MTNPTAETMSYKGNAVDSFVSSVSSPTIECMAPVVPENIPAACIQINYLDEEEDRAMEHRLKNRVKSTVTNERDRPKRSVKRVVQAVPIMMMGFRPYLSEATKISLDSMTTYSLRK